MEELVIINEWEFRNRNWRGCVLVHVGQFRGGRRRGSVRGERWQVREGVSSSMHSKLVVEGEEGVFHLWGVKKSTRERECSEGAWRHSLSKYMLYLFHDVPTVCRKTTHPGDASETLNGLHGHHKPQQHTQTHYVNYISNQTSTTAISMLGDAVTQSLLADLHHKCLECWGLHPQNQVSCNGQAAYHWPRSPSNQLIQPPAALPQCF